MEKVKIGNNAGILWHILNNSGTVSIFELCRKASLTFEETALAVGWLAREDKIVIHKQEDMLMISLSRNSCEFSFG